MFLFLFCIKFFKVKKKRIDNCGFFFIVKLFLNLEFVWYCIYCDFFLLKLSLFIVIIYVSYIFIVMYLFLINDMFIYIMIFFFRKLLMMYK